MMIVVVVILSDLKPDFFFNTFFFYYSYPATNYLGRRLQCQYKKNAIQLVLKLVISKSKSEKAKKYLDIAEENKIPIDSEILYQATRLRKKLGSLRHNQKPIE